MENSYIENDKLIRVVPFDQFSTTMRVETVITKEEFLMCYKAWIEDKEDEMSLKYKDEEFAEKIWSEFCKDTEGEWDQVHQPSPGDVIKWLIIKEYLKPIPKPVVRMK